VWWISIARSSYSMRRPTVAEERDFVTRGLQTTYRALGQLPGLGIAFAALLLVGLVLALTEARRRQHLERLAAPLALFGGSVAVLVIEGLGRAGVLGSKAASASRYSHLVAAMTLPAIAVAADAVIRRWRRLAVPVLALLLAGVPGNVRDLADFEHDQRQTQADYKQMMLSLPRVDFAKHVPRSVRPEPGFAYLTTIGWLRDGVANGRIPRPKPVGQLLRASDIFRLSIDQSTDAVPSMPCEIPNAPTNLTLAAGQSLRFYGGNLVVTPADHRLRATTRMLYAPTNGETLTAVAPIDMFVAVATPFVPATVCSTALRHGTP
jgi:hypothetical protein